MTRLSVLVTLALMSVGALAPVAAQPGPSAVSAWVAAPGAGATTAPAYIELKNPGMYDIYITSATADLAGKVELRAGAVGTAEPSAVAELTVPAYGSTQAAATAPHLRLLDLKRPLAVGDTVNLTLTTDAGLTLKVAAVVRTP